MRQVFQPTSQPVLVRLEAVRVSAVSVNATRRWRDRILSTVSESVMVVTEELQRDCWTRLGSDLPRRGESAVSVDSAVSFVGGPASAFLSGADGCADFPGEVAVVVMSPVVLSGDVAVRVALPAIAGVACPADLAELVAVDITSLADAGMVTVGVADLAYAGMAFPSDPAGAVTVGVASLANAGMVTVGVTVGVASLGNAGMALPADLAGEDTIGVTSLADAGMVTIGVTDLADAAPVDIAGVPEYGNCVISCGDRLSPGVWCRGRTLIQNNINSQSVNSVRCDPVGMGCTVPSDGSTDSFGYLVVWTAVSCCG